MANKMLIDASHPEETRVVVLRGNRVEDFDFESASKKPLRGNIYLAKVTRVEPSLQAAFIEYGGNRHGFLAFSEIHPDYYQIPVADRQALLEEEARAHREEDEEVRPSSGGNSNGAGGGRRSRRSRGGRGGQPSQKRADLGDESLAEAIDRTDGSSETSEGGNEPFDLADADRASSTPFGSDAVSDATDEPELPLPLGESFSLPDDEPSPFQADAPVDSADEVTDGPWPQSFDDDSQSEPADDRRETDVSTAYDEVVEAAGSDAMADADTGSDLRADADEHGLLDENAQAEDAEPVEQLGGDAMEETTFRAPRLRRHYKIQEVIKRRQILLVQVVKEERGNKGAALTTYLSLAGRYSVLMPNTARGGGISRKITDSDDRRRLKAIAQELDVPEGMGIILRTAGAARGETEVKRDFEYLLRMWETVRELTLSSSAPKLVYEEGSLIKRTIRDMYSKEFDEIWVSGDTGYREAKDYMRLLMPTHAKNVQLYNDPQPIFAKSGAEAQLDAMFSNHVTLKSGGYIVINQTEALVAIDVNSGRSTREHNIEDTALRTNLEAADEVARQLRLRDLAGLIVVDFIDMEEGRNNRAVERRIKDALKNDRARIQIGHISHFGLLEMSRQRIRTGVLEGSTVICPHCAGAGTVRSTSSIALHVLRVLEDTLIRSATNNLIVRTRTEVALYVLNQKRANLTDLEQRFGVTIVVLADDALTGTVYHSIERGDAATPPPIFGRPAGVERNDEIEAVDEDTDDAMVDDEGARSPSRDEISSRAVATEDEAPGERRRRRRRRRRGRDRDAGGPGLEAGDQPFVEFPEDSEDSRDGAERTEGSDHDTTVGSVDAAVDVQPAGSEQNDEAAVEVAEPPRRRRSRRPASRAAAAEADASPSAETASDNAGEEATLTPPRRSRRARGRAVEETPSSQLRLEAPSADRDVGADTAQNHPADVEPDSTAESTEALGLADLVLPPVETPDLPKPAAAEAEPEASEPPRPKRSGWWQRAKATLTGE